jgi:uncharacterized protein YjeT (DUF2065 family)
MVITMLAVVALLVLPAETVTRGHGFVVLLAGVGVYYVVKRLLQRR